MKSKIKDFKKDFISHDLENIPDIVYVSHKKSSGEKSDTTVQEDMTKVMEEGMEMIDRALNNSHKCLGSLLAACDHN